MDSGYREEAEHCGMFYRRKLRYATYLLTGPAASWWEAVLASQPTGYVVTWEEFKKRFREAHVPESIMELKRREFENLRQHESSIGRYVNLFNTLSRYALEEVDTEEKRKKRFMKGLNPFMKMQLRLAKPKEFQELVDAAITLEDDYKMVQEERRKKVRIEPRKFQVARPTPTLRFKPRPRTDIRRPISRNPNPMNQVICDNCGLTGHMKKDC